jgi:hypothetical protein
MPVKGDNIVFTSLIETLLLKISGIIGAITADGMATGAVGETYDSPVVVIGNGVVLDAKTRSSI